MNLHQLSSEAKAGHVEELNLIAIEGGDFVLEARVKGKAHPLSDARGERLKVHSVVDAQRLLNGLPAVPLHLVHWSVQDEMCGMESTGEEDLKVPMPRRSAW
ncbi:cation transporter [Pseudomonas sp. MAFF212428]|uniref:Cation transporter n=1 Tax=Pseudomonas brassicae TaxID=2708063 RepID=A0A6B3NY88_9PSED|nr:DUF6482 family protein [Pseudomonas brassicae]NER59109.1 cation transporter [Pseudomonas brassicae]NER65160.1 cation transporter [Pseudomonas brassicae]